MTPETFSPIDNPCVKIAGMGEVGVFKNHRGQSMVGMLVASAISIIILIAVTDVLNYMTRTQKSSELSLEFTLWKSTIAGLLRNQEECSAALSGNVVDTNDACPGTNNATVSRPAGCSNGISVNQIDCSAAGGTWTAKDFIKTGTASTVGLRAVRVCIEPVDASVNGGQLGNGVLLNERVYKVMLDIRAQKQQAAGNTGEALMGASYLMTSPYFLVTTNSASPPVIKHCGGPHDSWRLTNQTGDPAGKDRHAGVWNGGQFLTWAGNTSSSGNDSQEGGVYDSITDTWSTITTSGNPAQRMDHSGIWSGSLFVIWGGRATSGTIRQNGGRYDPVGNAWVSSPNLNNLNRPTGTYNHTAVWTGAKMITWGGVNALGAPVNSGGIYDPNFDQWTLGGTTLTGSPIPRHSHTAIWTGTQMIVWGGLLSTTPQNSGGMYDPATNTWTTVSTTGAPSARYNHVAVWTGSRMIVWGGFNGTTYLNDGGVFDPSTNSWLGGHPTTANAPTARQSHVGVWTGTRLLVWGGSIPGNGVTNTGGLYDLNTNSWVPTTAIGAPTARTKTLGWWTGSQLLIWGGSAQGGTPINTDTGALYTPAQ